MTLATVTMLPSTQVAEVKPERRHRPGVDYALGVIIGIVTLLTRIINIRDYPRWFTDEGVYVSQAWAVKVLGQLAPYTYWYDHPPGGWIQLAGWFGLSGALQRYDPSAIAAGREFMAVVAVITAVLLYALCRRLGFAAGFAFFAAMLYALSPLAIAYSRYVLLDNIAVAWTLAAMFLTLNPKRKISAAIFAAICMGIAALSKETALLYVPAVVYLGARHYRRVSNKMHAFIVSASIFVIVGAMYPLAAALKQELIPGPDHVSLIEGQVLFQLTNRTGSGSILDPASDARQLAEGAWLSLDRWLPYGSLALLIPGLFMKKTRGPAIALGVLVAMMLRGGYLPYPFVIGMLPFMAMIVAGVADTLWTWARRRSRVDIVAIVLMAVALAIPSVYALGAGPRWVPVITRQLTENAAASQEETIAWVERELPREATIITEGELWLDIVNRGFENSQVVWIYKVDTDPAVRSVYSRTGVDFLLLNQVTIDQRQEYPTVNELLNRVTVVATFGEGVNKIVIMKVNQE